MAAELAEQTIQNVHILKEIEIAAPVEIAFEAVLEQLGPGSEMPGKKPFPMVIEPKPGGRWYRDLGDNNGHLWGHVQSIKRPTLIELIGPMFMSYPVAGHIEYKLSEIEGGTRVSLRHRALGMIDDAHRQGVTQGWRQILDALKTAVES